MRWTVAALAVALAGCAGRTPPPAIEVRTVEVKVPVPVSCVKREDIAPEPPYVASRLTGQAKHDLLVVDESALQLRTWGQALAAQLIACASSPAAPATSR